MDIPATLKTHLPSNVCDDILNLFPVLQVPDVNGSFFGTVIAIKTALKYVVLFLNFQYFFVLLIFQQEILEGIKCLLYNRCSQVTA